MQMLIIKNLRGYKVETSTETSHENNSKVKSMWEELSLSGG